MLVTFSSSLPHILNLILARSDIVIVMVIKNEQDLVGFQHSDCIPVVTRQDIIIIDKETLKYASSLTWLLLMNIITW